LALIEFLLKNWIFVIIALALLSQFRKKASTRRDQSQSSEKSGMPAFGGSPTIPGSLAGKTINKPAAVKQQASGSGFNPPPKSSKGTLMDNKRTLMDSGASSPLLRESSQPDNLYRDAYADSSTTNTMQTSKQQLAQGIIWAEILGPPRAKKPFRRR
jgi:hypothetical protein